MYVERIPSKQRGKLYTTTLIRESFKHKGKVLHRTLANLSKLPARIIQQIQRILSGAEVSFQKTAAIVTTGNVEYGASQAFLGLARRLGLDTYVYSRQVPWREDVLAMIVGRLVYQGSKLHLTNLYASSALWTLCGHPPGQRPDVDRHCYAPLDRLLSRQAAIQKRLAQTHLRDGCLVLYDLTSSYLEGEYEGSELVAFGKPHDGRAGYEQIAIGLITNAAGCPVAVEVFRGNTSDQTTVLGQAQTLAHKYGVKDAILAGDRGMLTPRRIAEVNELGYKTLTALTHPQMQELLERKVIQLEFFDERGIAEANDPDTPAVRYLLCKNPATAAEETGTRQRLLLLTEQALAKMAGHKKRGDPQKMSARVGKILARYKVGKFFDWRVEEGRLTYHVDRDHVQTEQALDGCYVVRTEVPTARLSKQEAVAGYKRLTAVEKAFRNLKTVSLEIRPIHHHLDQRIRAHVFLCMLAYYVQWHALEALKPLFAADGKGADRKWSWAIVLERLKAIRQETVLIGEAAIDMVKTRPDEEQNRILELLKVNL